MASLTNFSPARLLGQTLFCGWLAISIAAGARAADVDLPALIAKVEPAVVRIEAQAAGAVVGIAQGSGFVIAEGVVTNYHVIDNTVAAKVIFNDGAEAPVEGVRVWDVERDIAILAVHGMAAPPKLTLSTKLPQKGERTAAFGAPFGFSFTTSDGIVSALRTGAEIRKEIDEYDQPDDLTWIQTTAPISSGNSGGPLVDSSGSVIGVNTWTYASGQNLNFALSSVEVAKVAAKIKPGVPTRLAALPKAEVRTADQPELRAAKVIFRATAKKAFHEAVNGRLQALEPAASALKAALWSEEATPESLASAEAEYESALGELKALKEYRPTLGAFLQDKDAVIGSPGEWFVIEVLKDQSMLVKPNEASREIFRVTGVPTAGVADDVSREFGGVWFVSGETFEFRTIRGPLTVYGIRSVDLDPQVLIDDFVAEVVNPTVERHLKELSRARGADGRGAGAAAGGALREQLAEMEKDAAFLLDAAKRFIPSKMDVAQRRLREIVDKYPETKERWGGASCWASIRWRRACGPAGISRPRGD